jgi:CRISPR-associated protein Cmr2
MVDASFWQTKLHARLHDPAEKALVLLRDPEGHEGGTSRALHRDLGFDTLPVKEWLDPDNGDILDTVLFKKGIPITMYRDVKRADWWAAGADRPQWPMQEITVTTKTGQTKTRKVADWAQVRWAKEPILIHPLTGQPFDLKSLADTDIEDIKQRSFDHFSRLTVKEGEAIDWKRTLLAYWRFGPELAEDEDNGKLGMLWPLLPADTRVPDHSIWDHLDLTSAFAGSFAADRNGEAALLVMSLGPVQSFIAAARSTSDMWAGSHLLSRLSWESMKIVCERLGPDAILFPRLRGVPQIDLWLRDEMKLPKEWFEHAIWQDRATDANPLFAAALPNRFVAVVPASQISEIAADVTSHVRDWLQRCGKIVAACLLRSAGYPDDESVYAYDQIRRQLEGFPEVHWASVPFSLIRSRNTDKQTDLDISPVVGAMAPFFGARRGEACGFLASPAWRVLGKEIPWSDNTTFFDPKPGVLYPAVYELAERMLAAAKTTHAFEQLQQHGWRDSLTGESEWLSVQQNQLGIPPGQRADTLWARIAKAQPAWAKTGEHLGALSAIKRLWPTIFAEEVRDVLAIDRVSRFVVSTHTMALAHQLENWLEGGSPIHDDLCDRLSKVEPVALPRRLMARFASRPELKWAKSFPALLDEARENPEDADARHVEKLVQDALSAPKTGGKARVETYYAFLMMDGDEMGAWLSGSKEKDSASYRGCFHPMVGAGFDRQLAKHELLRRYGEQPRAMSPNRHIAISAALNDFALHAVPEVIESEYLGRVIYAGGDDVLAMLPVADLIPAMQRLRWAYSGHEPSTDLNWRQARRSNKLMFANGFGLLRGRRLLRLMGEKATASCGAIIAHHQAPLSAVLRELRVAEQRAKTEGGRNAWSVSLMKRSGGTVNLTAKWGEPVCVLQDLHRFLADPDVSRRAVYNTLEWLNDLPPRDPDLLGGLLAYQFKRQASGETARGSAGDIAKRLVKVAFDANQRPNQANPIDWIQTFLIGAEFLAREVRSDTAVQAGRRGELAQ